MKKIVSILLSTIIFCSLFAVPLSVGAKTINIESSSSADCEDGYRFVEIYKSGITKDGWEYDIIKEQNINTDEYKFFAAIGSYKGTATTVTLPTNVLKYYDGSLRDSSTVKKAIIPNSNTKIQISNSFFRGSSTLEEVTVGSAVKSIYSAMFCDCTKLKAVNFTKEFLAQKPYIGAGAFTRCTSLRNLVLPKGISGVSADALAGCKNLNTITFGEDIKSCPITSDNINLTNIKLLRKKSDVGLMQSHSVTLNRSYPIEFVNKPVTVECYEGTRAAYYIQNVYPTKSGFENSYKFVSLGQCEGTPYSHPTTAPPTTTAPYTASVGEGNEWYLAGTFNSYTRDDSTKLIYNPTSKTLEKGVTLDKGDYEFIVCDINTSHRFNLIKGGILGDNNCPDPSKFSIATDNTKIKFVFDGIKVRMYINEQEVTSTTLPPTTTTTNTTVSSTTVTTSTTVSTTIPSTSNIESSTEVSNTIPVKETIFKLSKYKDNLYAGFTKIYNYYFDNTETDSYVTFTSNNRKVAQVNFIGNNTANRGKFSVVPLSKGTAIITAIVYNKAGIEVAKRNFKVTVNQLTVVAKANKKTVQNNRAFNVKKTNTKVQLTATVNPSNITKKGITYKSSNPKVATVNSKGLVTTKKVGYTNVVIASREGNAKFTLKITVGNTATKIVISPYKNITKVNSLAKINYSVYYENKKTNLYNIKPTWKSNKTSVATVDKNGNVTAKKKGICSIVATFNDGRSIYSNKCLVVVGNRVSNVVKTNYKNTIVLKKNSSVTLKAEVKNNNATYKDCNWYLGKNKYAKISNVKNKGNKSHFYSQAKVTAKKKGTCYVYCKTKDGSNKQLRYKIIIK